MPMRSMNDNLLERARLFFTIASLSRFGVRVILKQRWSQCRPCPNNHRPTGSPRSRDSPAAFTRHGCVGDIGERPCWVRPRHACDLLVRDRRTGSFENMTRPHERASHRPVVRVMIDHRTTPPQPWAVACAVETWADRSALHHAQVGLGGAASGHLGV